MLLFTLPLFAVALIYGAAALLPAIYLMKYIYRKDTVEKEPSMLLMSLLIYGVIAALISIALEGIGTKILNSLMDQSSVGYTLVLAFVVVAMVEEGAKFAMLKRRTWREVKYNYRFDGIVYAVFVSLGFAAFENIGYVLGYGLSVAPARALLAVPGHMCFGVFMGTFYGRAKQCQVWGDKSEERANLWLGYIVAVLLHGFYDSCAMINTVASSITFIAFVVIMYIVVIKKVNKESQNDGPII